MSQLLTEDIKQKCHELCSQYVWLNISRNDVSFERIIGGITNQMIKCKLLANFESNKGKPSEIAIKLYRKDRPLDASDSVFNDLIIDLIVSKEGLGPKIYGISRYAVIMEYIQCRQFNAEDSKNQLIVEELGKKLAKAHSLRPPINKNSQWIENTFTETNLNSYKSPKKSDLIKTNGLNHLIDNDFQTEFNLLIQLIGKSDSPIVFSHNDFGFNNILVKNQIKDSVEEKVVLSDFEFSSYGHRGQDFGIIFNDWINFNNKFYDCNCDHIIEPFLKSYLSENIRIYGENYANNRNNSIKHLLYESKVFLLLQKLFSVLYFLNADQTIFAHLTQLEIMMEANRLFGEYLRLKRVLAEENKSINNFFKLFI